jgi:hypothetical protein
MASMLPGPGGFSRDRRHRRPGMQRRKAGGHWQAAGCYAQAELEVD